MSQPSQTRNMPERKFGPYANGIGVAVWVNRIETDEGPRVTRSVSINPRRYKDRQTGEWKNAASYGVNDVHLLLIALEQARDYLLTQPIPEADGSTA